MNEILPDGYYYNTMVYIFTPMERQIVTDSMFGLMFLTNAGDCAGLSQFKLDHQNPGIRLTNLLRYYIYGKFWFSCPLRTKENVSCIKLIVVTKKKYIKKIYFFMASLQAKTECLP